MGAGQLDARPLLVTADDSPSMTHALFSGWSGPGRVLAGGVLAYVALVFVLRISGKRTLAKMNAFDLVVTVALGSALSSTLLSRTIPVTDGAVAFALLAALQFGTAWAGIRSRRFRRLVKSDPTLLVRNGVLLNDVMRRERVDRDDILAAIRSKGISAVGDVRAVVLETDGSFSVLRRDGGREGGSSLADVAGADPDAERERAQ